MRKLLTVLLIVAVTGSCATSVALRLGTVNQFAKEVSVQELLGRPDAFDGKPVRVIGVAWFDFRFEERSKIYVSKSDALHDTFSYVEITSFAPEVLQQKNKLTRLSGQYVLIEGIFHAHPPENDELNTICIRCGKDSISNVNRVEAWR